LIELRADLGLLAHLLLEEAELEGERDQPLLRTIVEVALQALALLLAGVDHPRPRARELDEPSLELGLQPGVLERDAGRGDHGLE